MSVAIECTCGRTGKVRPDLAGRRVRCPACRSAVVAGAQRSEPAWKQALPGRVARAKAAVAAGAKRSEPAWKQALPRPAAPGRALARKAPRPGGAGAPPRTRDRARATGPQRDLGHERHLRAIGVCYRVWGVLLALAGLATGALIGGPLLIASGIALAAGGGVFLLGHALFAYSNAARLVALVLVALGMGSSLVQAAAVGGPALAGAALPLAWNAALVWALGCPAAARICSPRYQALVRAAPRREVAWWTSPFFVVPAVITGVAVCAAVVGLGALLGSR